MAKLLQLFRFLTPVVQYLDSPLVNITPQNERTPQAETLVRLHFSELLRSSSSTSDHVVWSGHVGYFPPQLIMCIIKLISLFQHGFFNTEACSCSTGNIWPTIMADLRHCNTGILFWQCLFVSFSQQVF